MQLLKILFHLHSEKAGWKSVKILWGELGRDLKTEEEKQKQPNDFLLLLDLPLNQTLLQWETESKCMCVGETGGRVEHLF